MAVAVEPVKKSDLWVLENADVAIGVQKSTGWIRSATWKGTNIDLFQQVRGGIPGYIGGIRVFDEHDRAWYSDLDTPCKIEDVKKRGQTVTLTKEFRNAPFVLTLTLKMDNDCLTWQVDAVKRNKKVADRSLRVYFMFPLIAGWDIWAPCNEGERTFDGMTPFEHMYTQIPYVSEQEIILPMFSHYNRRMGVGYSMVDPIDANVPAAKFVFNNAEKCFNWGSMHKDIRDVPVLEGINYYIGLVKDRPMSTKMMLFFHGGDWRPGLGKVYKRWQPYFDPWNDAIYEREGVFRCGGVQDADNVAQWCRMGLKTLEVHGHFQDYCDYFNDGKDEWLTISAKESLRHRWVKEEVEKAAREGKTYDVRNAEGMAEKVEEFCATHTAQEIADYLGWPIERVRHRREDIKRRLEILDQAGIACHWYFNYTDGYRPRVEKQWPDSISKDEDGKPIPSGWYMSHNMNADPRWSFGQFAYESAKKIFDTYPTLKGFFLDCFRHYEIDFAHDDGVTVVNGKPCYSMNRSYDDIERKIKEEIMRPRNLTSFANKPMSIRSMRYCDGQLLEGNGDQYEEKFFWASIANPMFFMWTHGDCSLDENLRRAVLHGCYPREDEPTEENIALYQKYLPLYAQFKRRIFCFEPDPMRPPKGSRGKLYTVADGYVAGIINLAIDAGDEVKWAKRPTAHFRVARGHDITRVGMMLPGDREFREVPFKFDGTFLRVPMEGYTNCAVVKLFVTKETGKPIGPETFASKPRVCGDPDSSFEDISDR